MQDRRWRLSNAIIAREAPISGHGVTSHERIPVRDAQTLRSAPPQSTDNRFPSRAHLLTPSTSPHPMPPKKKLRQPTSTTIYYGGPSKVATSFTLGNGFEAISVDAEHRHLNRDLAARSECVHHWLEASTD